MDEKYTYYKCFNDMEPPHEIHYVIRTLDESHYEYNRGGGWKESETTYLRLKGYSWNPCYEHEKISPEEAGRILARLGKNNYRTK